MPIEWLNGIPYLSNESFIGEVPEYTQLLIRGAMPVGCMLPFAGTQKPDGWLLCNGGVYNKADYPILEGVIGTQYGGTPGSTFAVPNLLGRTVVASGNDGATRAKNWAVGERTGQHDHILDVNQIPAHSHRIGGRYMFQGVGADSYALGDCNPALKQGVETWTDNTGNSWAHNNIQPSTVVNSYIIKHDYPLHG